jgi:hypothetical protein
MTEAAAVFQPGGVRMVHRGLLRRLKKKKGHGSSPRVREGFFGIHAFLPCCNPPSFSGDFSGALHTLKEGRYELKSETAMFHMVCAIQIPDRDPQ